MPNYEVVLTPESGSIYRPEMEVDSPHKVYLYPTTGCTNFITNGGASNTTDWTNPTGGLAQYWNLQGGFTTTIVTGNGFTGNAQRCASTTTQSNCNLYQMQDTVTEALNYRISFQYRSSFAIELIWKATAGGSWQSVQSFPANTGNAVSTGVFNSIPSQASYIAFGTLAGTLTNADWFEVDNVVCCHPS